MPTQAASSPAYPSLLNRPTGRKTFRGDWAVVMAHALAKLSRAIWYREKIVKILSAAKRHLGRAPKKGPFIVTFVRLAPYLVLESINVQL